MIKNFIKKIIKFIVVFFSVYIFSTLLILPIRIFLFEPLFLRDIEEGGLTGVKENQYVLVDKISYKFREPKIGELIVYKTSIDSSNKNFSRISKVLPDGVEVRGEKWSSEIPSRFVPHSLIIGRISPINPFIFISIGIFLVIAISTYLTLFLFRRRNSSKDKTRSSIN